jgi:signal transduction histidine kinase
MNTDGTTLLDGTRAKQSQQETEALYLLMDQLPVGIFHKNMEGRHLFMNKWLCRLKAARGREFPGKTSDEFAAGECKPKYSTCPESMRDISTSTDSTDLYKLVIESGQPITMEEGYIGADGEAQYLQVTQAPLFSSDGTIIGTQGVILDITAQKRVEAKLTREREILRTLMDSSKDAIYFKDRQSRFIRCSPGMALVFNLDRADEAISASLLLASRKKSYVSGLVQAVGMINDHSADLRSFLADDPKGKALPAYLTRVSERISNERERTIAELESLRLTIDHIKEIVAVQQSYATVSGVAETIKISDLVEDAWRIAGKAAARGRIALIREYIDLPAVSIEKHKVLQILVNLICNARQACDDSRRDDKEIKIKISHSGQRVCIAVIDNGVGIPPENQKRIFIHGFTPRRGGHGLGLCNGALAAAALGGTLSVHSDGAGHGSTFILELPFPRCDAFPKAS